MGYGIWDGGLRIKDIGAESNGGSPTEGGVDGRPVSWFLVLKRILLLFWLLKINPVT
jgi:hypothetical protein